MDITTTKKAFWGTYIVPIGLSFMVPDEVGVGLISRGIAKKTEPTKKPIGENLKEEPKAKKEKK